VTPKNLRRRRGRSFPGAGREAVIDLEQFAPVCDSMK